MRAVAPRPDRLEHYVSHAPFEPLAAEQLTPEQERFYRASQWQIMWWKFRRHRIAVISGVILLLFYGSTLVSEVLAPYELHSRNSRHIYAPPQKLQLFHEGAFVGPFVYGYSMRLNLATLKREYQADTSKVQPLRFFCRGDEYRFWNLVEGSFHLFCPAEGGTAFLLGTDSVREAMRWLVKLGSRWRPMTRGGEAPMSTAACAKSSSRSASSLERTARASPGQSSSPRMMVMPK